MEAPDRPAHRLGLGLAALGRPAYINLGRDGVHRSVEELRAVAHASLDAAYAAGVRHVDAARSYGRAEEFLGSWLAASGHGAEVTVSSKWGYRYTADWRPDARVHEVKEHTLAHLETQWSESLAALGRAPALHQVHSLTDDSPLFDDAALLAALARLRDDLGVRLGFSTSGAAQPGTVRRGLSLSVAGAPLFTAVQSTWNVLEPSVGDVLREAHDDGVLVLVKEGLANGRLAVEAPAAVREIAGRHGVGPDAVALAAVLDRPWADVVLSGAASPDQVRANVAALDVALTDDDRTALGALAEDPGDYWAHRASLSWG